MRILIFGEAFMPPAYMPRVRYFCSYFLERGWQVDYVVESSGHEQCIPEGVHVLPIPYYTYTSGRKAKAEWLLKFFLGLVCDYKGRYFYRKSRPFWQDGAYDLVFCSSCFVFPLTTASRAAAKLGIPFFADMRDIPEQAPDDDYYLRHKPPRFGRKWIFATYKQISISRRNRALRTARAVTTVSPWHVQTLSSYNPNVRLIYNGFDEKHFYPEQIRSEHFVISYFGQVFNASIRNPRLLFEAVCRMKENHEDFERDLQIDWYIDNQSETVIREIASDYDLEAGMTYHRFVQQDELTQAMNRSSVLLVLNNIRTEKRYFGIMTTKFFEAVGVNRPVLSIPDNQDNLSKLVQETRCGLASSDVQEVMTFLTEKYTEWKKYGHVAGTVPEAYRLDYSRRKGAEILENLFQEMTKTGKTQEKHLL